MPYAIPVGAPVHRAAVNAIVNEIACAYTVHHKERPVQESSASVSRSFFRPLWVRIAFACFMFAASAVAMWDEVYRFDWVGLLCFGLYSLISVPMRKGEEPSADFSEPRRIISFALIVLIGAAALHSLYYRFTK